MKLHKILFSCNLTYRVWSTSKRHTEIKLLPHREHRRLNYKDWPFNIIQSLIIVWATRNTYIGLQCACTAQWLLYVLSGSVLNTPHHVHRIMYRYVFSIITTIHRDNLQCSTPQCMTLQCSTPQCMTLQCSTPQCMTLQCSTPHEYSRIKPPNARIAFV